MRYRTLPMVLAALATGGCVARTAWNVATLPVRAGSKAVDWTTTSRDEADRNRGREMRRQEERDRKEARREERRRRSYEQRLARDQPY